MEKKCAYLPLTLETYIYISYITFLKIPSENSFEIAWIIFANSTMYSTLTSHEEKKMSAVSKILSSQKMGDRRTANS